MNNKSSVPLSVSLAYSAPHIASTWLIAPMGIIQGIYAKHYGLPLTLIAAAILLAKVFDAITDPMIGYYSDRYYQQKKTRKPFILTGGLVLVLSGYFLFVPTNIVTLQPVSEVHISYFIIWFFVFFLAWTLFEIPHLAWANDLALKAEDKLKIFSMRTAAYYLGLLLFYLVPLLPFFDTNNITPDTLRVSVFCAGFSMFVLLPFCLLQVPNRNGPATLVWSDDFGNKDCRPFPSCNSHAKKKKLSGIFVALIHIYSNKPYVIFIASFLLKAISTGMFYGLFYIYVDAYLGLGDHFAQASIVALGPAIVSVPVWYRLSEIVGKKNTWICSVLIIFLTFLYVGSFKPEETQFHDLVLAMGFLSAGAACMWGIGSAMLAEVIDYSTWKYRVEKTASYFSLYAFMNKVSWALSSSLGLGIAGWYGFDVSAASHSAETVWGLRMAMVWVPLAFAAMAVCMGLFIPINTRRHAIIRRRLDTLNERDKSASLSSLNAEC